MQSINLQSTLVIPITPEQLRQIANQMERTAANVTLPGETILCVLTDRVTLQYEPEAAKMTRFLNLRHEDVATDLQH